MTEPIWKVQEGDGPIVAGAIHDGHALREEIHPLLAIDEQDRLREEDPHTAGWTEIAPNRVVGLRSRFEVDLNRARHEAVYRTPEDAWGLEVWKSPPPPELIERSLAEYDQFYAAMEQLFRRKAEQHGLFLVLDLHSYNHRRGGPTAPPDDPQANPEVNVGTGTMDRSRWAPLVDRFLAELSACTVAGRRLDVRENVKFQGRGFPRFVHGRFPQEGCALAVEFKKIFMDEWTGRLDEEAHREIRGALGSTIPGLLEELAGLGARLRS
ncbi:MAG: N-formylglutamate amidohydrolase [Deltaproteobacteria bacterium]|jgi:N-formylglutamate amidohydrolase|nr:N-formylglutamate amidohydrolase [Deltaproteobacteria bacterium]MBW2531564.1 N-formylglutamate amidohydrolase [Deltaproteobacteria bacterium]